MDKTVLEKRIEERANERFEKEFKEFVNYVYLHPVGKRLTITIGDRNVPIVNFGKNYGLFNEDGLKNKRSENTNLQLVRDQLLEEYRKEETDDLLNKLDSIGYLFNQQ